MDGKSNGGREGRKGSLRRNRKRPDQTHLVTYSSDGYSVILMDWEMDGNLN